MPALSEMSVDALEALHRDLQGEYEAQKAKGLSLDMTRGKPSPEQLDLANGMMALPGNRDHLTESGEDARNYGGIQGLPEVRSLFAPVLGAPAAQIVVGNNSSLAMMHDFLVYALLRGVPGGAKPWAKEEQISVLCPVPGYDRHFGLTDSFGIKLIPVPLTGEGPDMDAVEKLALDPSVKAIWCVPQYANPSGETYSDAIVERLARMKTGAGDFRILWDNAYALHHLSDARPSLRNILEACTEAGNPDRPIIFASTSKVTLAGGGLAFLAGSTANIHWYLDSAGKRTIGPDKLNQLRHVRFLKDMEGVGAHMEKHRALIAPKFAAVDEAFERRLAPFAFAQWSKPLGGYFTILDVMPGTAVRVVALAKAAGLALTPAGSTHPYGEDPQDKTLRIAPTYPSLADVKLAAETISLCTLLAGCEKELAARRS